MVARKVVKLKEEPRSVALPREQAAHGIEEDDSKIPLHDEYEYRPKFHTRDPTLHPLQTLSGMKRCVEYRSRESWVDHSVTRLQLKEK